MLKRLVVVIAFFVSTLSSAAARVDSTFVPGISYFGRNNYIEYIAGNSPYIFSAPHDGALTPTEIPNRTGNITTGHDTNVQDLIRKIGQSVFTREGRYPHIIICHLDRIKIDANRELAEATQGNAYAIQAWKEWHSFIDTAAQQVQRSFGRGFYIDLHGYSSHPIQRLEIGYLLSGATLALSDAALNSPANVNSSSIRTMVTTSGLSLSQLLRGPRSLGSFFENRGYPAVPSEKQPNPGSAEYFSAGIDGYNTQRHGSLNGGPISGVQIECNMTGVRDTENARKNFAEAFADVVKNYTSQNLFVTSVFDQSAVPLQPALLQNYPNPFNPTTSFEFRLPARQTDVGLARLPDGQAGQAGVSSYRLVTLRVFDLLGREVTTLVNETMNPGTFVVQWNAADLPTGVYFYQLRAGSFVDTKKLILTK